jgi:hypothetical protein
MTLTESGLVIGTVVISIILSPELPTCGEMLTRSHFLGSERDVVLLLLEWHALLAQVNLQLLVAGHGVSPFLAHACVRCLRPGDVYVLAHIALESLHPDFTYRG